jgi:hypothetical protein
MCWFQSVAASTEREVHERREAIRVVSESAVQHAELDDNGVFSSNQGDARTLRLASGTSLWLMSTFIVVRESEFVTTVLLVLNP